MVRIPAGGFGCWAGVLAGLAAGVACGSDPFQGEVAACRCEATGCPETDCPVEVVLGDRCAGQVSFAEVVMDGHIEEGVVRPGEVMRTCGRIPLGGVSRVTARGGVWLWGPLEEACEVAGETRRLVLDCAAFGEAPPTADASSGGEEDAAETASSSPAPDAAAPETQGAAEAEDAAD